MKILTLSFLVTMCISVLHAQITAVTSNGDTINVYDNGTWEPINRVQVVSPITARVNTTVKVDEFDNKKTVTSDMWNRFAEDKLKKYINASIIKIDDGIAILLSYSGDLGCLSNYTSTIKIKLTNGEIVECAQISDTDCGDFPSANFHPLTKEQMDDPAYTEIVSENIKLLESHDWEMIRLSGSDYYTDLYPRASSKIPNPEQFFRQHLISVNSR